MKKYNVLVCFTDGTNVQYNEVDDCFFGADINVYQITKNNITVAFINPNMVRNIDIEECL